MINFFRKIRQNLLTENKVSKYLLYAIGEIVLVVIGILIALQINNWNEKRKEVKVETKILLEIKNNLQSDLIDLEENIINYGKRAKSHEYIINWIESNQSFQDSLQNSIFITSYPSDIFINRTAYENLKGYGLSSVSSESLRNQISHLYEFQYKRYIDYNNQHTDAVKVINSDYAKYFNGNGFPPSENLLFKNLDELKSDFSFSYHQKSAKLMCGLLSVLISKEIKKELNKTIDMIDEELKSRL